MGVLAPALEAASFGRHRAVVVHVAPWDLSFHLPSLQSISGAGASQDKRDGGTAKARGQQGEGGRRRKGGICPSTSHLCEIGGAGDNQQNREEVGGRSAGSGIEDQRGGKDRKGVRICLPPPTPAV